jgi:predicted transcriptional regulator
MLKKPTPHEAKTAHLGIRIETELKVRLKRLADANDITVSEVVKQLLVRGVEREETAVRR